MVKNELLTLKFGNFHEKGTVVAVKFSLGLDAGTHAGGELINCEKRAILVERVKASTRLKGSKLCDQLLSILALVDPQTASQNRLLDS